MLLERAGSLLWLGIVSLLVVDVGCAYPTLQASGKKSVPSSQEQSFIPLNSPNAAINSLALGINHYYANNKTKALEVIKQAISQENLSTEGKILGYWYLYLSERDCKQPDFGAESLSSFITISQEMIEQMSADSAIHHPRLLQSRQFSEAFQLEERLTLGKIMLDALWARRDLTYGRTPDKPIQVHNSHAQRLFLAVLKPCGESEQANNSAKVEFDAYQANAESQPLDHALVSCPNQTTSFNFYFQNQVQVVSTTAERQ